MVILKLALSNFLARKVRVALTVAAIALSVSLVVSVTSGYASVEAAVYQYLAQYMGTTDVEITKANNPSGGTPDSILALLRADPEVEKVDGRYELGNALADSKGRPKPKRAAVIGLRRPEDTGSDFLKITKGAWFETSRGNVAVIDQAIADSLKLDIGDEFMLPGAASPGDAAGGVLGGAPGEEAPAEETPAEEPAAGEPTTDEAAADGGQSADAAGGEEGAGGDAVDGAVDGAGAGAEASAVTVDAVDDAAPATQPAARKGLRLKVVGIVHKPALLAAYMHSMYVPLETLQEFAGKPGQLSRISVQTRDGVDLDAFEARWKPKLEAIDPNLKLRTARETRRTMDKNLQGIHALSYLGGTVSMLAATFIVLSALSMGVAERQRTLAMLRAVGAFRGQVGWLVVLEGLALAVAGVLVGVPLGWAWITILAAMYSDVFAAGVVPSWGGIVFGSLGSILAALAASFLPAWSAMRVTPLEAMSPQSGPTDTRIPWKTALVGLLLIAIDPLLFFGPVERVAAAFGSADPEGTARAVRFYAHFGVGLPALMVGFFLLSPMFVWATERVFGPLVAAMFGLRYTLLRQQLTTGIWRAAGTCSALMVGLSVLVVMQTNGHTMLRGWRLPDKFPDIFIMAGVTSGLNWQQQAKLATVPGVREGDVMPVGIASPEYGSNIFGIGMAAMMPNATMFIAVPPDKVFKMMELEFKEGNPVDAARMLALGDHLVVTEEFRQLKGLGVGDTLALKTNKGKKDFTIAGVVWSPGIDVMVSMFDLGRQFDQRTAASVFGSLEDGRKYFGIEQIYLFAANLEYGVEREDMLKRVQKHLGAQGMRAGDVRHIKANIQQGFARLLLLISTVAFAAMAVASLGVTNTIMASIRSRRWQFGILRSIGVTRAQLLRLVLAEAFLIGLVGVGLGLAAGFLMSLDANQLSAVLTGYKPPIYIPWPIIWVGVGIVMGISMLACLWPAASVARSEPLTLLQAGRASE
jgi:putative ABC transport system permease protein